MICIEVIETNLIIDENNFIRDHQSRVVEADSWDEYCKAHKNYDGKAVLFKSKVMKGNSIQSNFQRSDWSHLAVCGDGGDDDCRRREDEACFKGVA